MSDTRSLNIRTFLEASGGIAVLIGLIFVGLELRQNTAAVQAATFQDLTHASSDFLMDIGSDPENRRVYNMGLLEPDLLSEEDRRHFYYLQQAYWLRMQNAFMQWQRGTLTDDDWFVYRTIACTTAMRPGPEAYWRGMIGINRSFKAFLESCRE
jgi:hypothetical protein